MTLKLYDTRSGVYIYSQYSQPWQDAIKPGDHYLILSPFVGVSVDGEWQVAETLNIPVFGEILNAEGCAPGFFNVRAYSYMCPEGEYGLISILDPTRILAPAEFEAAQQSNWRLEE